MKQVHAQNRLIALLLAVTMLLSAAACGGRETSPDASSSTPQDTSSTGVPAFVNPLPDADLSAVAEPKKPCRLLGMAWRLSRSRGLLSPYSC